MICDFMPVSVADYPGNVAATIFISGCNFRCPYCHNSSIIEHNSGFAGLSRRPKDETAGSYGPDENAAAYLKHEEIIDYLEERKKLIDGVCITGGEPTLWPGLKGLMSEIKALGFKVKLDTNGTRPRILEELMEEGLADYVAMDIKAPVYKYRLFALDEKDILNVQKSAEVILSHGAPGGKTDYEFRTTVHGKILGFRDLEEIGRWLSGAKRYVLQGYKHSPEVLDQDFCGTRPCDVSFLNEARTVLSKYFQEVLIRS